MTNAGPIQPSITLPIPYFGDLPPWFGLFLQTCACNPSIRWKFFTDLTPPGSLPANVEFIRLTLTEFCRLASRRLGFHVSIQDPYKLCDFKPALGLILRDYLADADYWGYSDCDVFYGHFRRFANVKLLQDYEIISTLDYRLNGPLTLMRNVPRINELVLSHPHVQAVLNYTEGPLKGYCMFDELLLTELLKTRSDIRVYYDHTGMQQHARHPGAYLWLKGRMYNVLSGQECMFVHFNDWKKRWIRSGFHHIDSPAWLVTRPGVIPVDIEDTSSGLRDAELSDPYKQHILEQFSIANPNPNPDLSKLFKPTGRGRNRGNGRIAQLLSRLGFS